MWASHAPTRATRCTLMIFQLQLQLQLPRYASPAITTDLTTNQFTMDRAVNVVVSVEQRIGPAKQI